MSPFARSPSTHVLPWIPFVLVVLLVASFAHVAGAATITWNNPAGGSWSNPNNWSPAEVPDSPGESAVLPDLSSTYQVTLDVDPTIDGLELVSGATLDLNGRSLTGSGLSIGSGSTVRGAGVIDMGNFPNGGLLEADGAAGERIQINGIVRNAGTIRVLHGGTVNVNRPLLENLGGTITSGDGGGTFSILMPYDALGTLDNLEGGGSIVADGGDLTIRVSSVLEGVVEPGGGSGVVNLESGVLQNVTVAAGAELAVTGHANLMARGTSLTNNGTVRVKGSIHFGIRQGDYEVYLGGTGTMILEGGTLGSGSGAILVNQAGQTILGCGTINPPFINHGTVDLTCGNPGVPHPRWGDWWSARVRGRIENFGRLRIAHGNLSIDAGAVLTNRGTISAAGGTITVGELATVDNSAGGKLTAEGGAVYLSGATVIGGRLDASGAGSFQVRNAATLRDVTIGPDATLVTQAGAVTTVAGARLLNQGTNRIAGTLVLPAGTEYVQTAGATLMEGGVISGSGSVQIQGGGMGGTARRRQSASPLIASAPATLQFYARAREASVVLELPQAAHLDGRVFDAAGRQVGRIADGAWDPGVHVFALDGSSGAAVRHPSGTYFARMVVTTQGVSEVLKAKVALVR